MKKFVILSLGVALSGAAVGTSTCGAQSSPHPVRLVCGRAYTPPKGGALRKQIADALRRNVGQHAGVYVVFNFDWLKVNGNWAYVETHPESPDGANKYEPVSALLRRSNGLWSVAARADADDETSPTQALHRLKNKFPSAPRDIFP